MKAFTFRVCDWAKYDLSTLSVFQWIYYGNKCCNFRKSPLIETIIHESTIAKYAESLPPTSQKVLFKSKDSEMPGERENRLSLNYLKKHVTTAYLVKDLGWKNSSNSKCAQKYRWLVTFDSHEAKWFRTQQLIQMPVTLHKMTLRKVILQTPEQRDLLNQNYRLPRKQLVGLWSDNWTSEFTNKVRDCVIKIETRSSTLHFRINPGNICTVIPP